MRPSSSVGSVDVHHQMGVRHDQAARGHLTLPFAEHNNGRTRARSANSDGPECSEAGPLSHAVAEQCERARSCECNADHNDRRAQLGQIRQGGASTINIAGAASNHRHAPRQSQPPSFAVVDRAMWV